MRSNSLLKSLLPLTLILTSCVTAQAQNPPLYSPIMHLSRVSGSSSLLPFQARPDGSGLQQLNSYPVNLSWHGVQGLRYSLTAQARTGYPSNESTPNDLIVTDESGTIRTVLASAQDTFYKWPTWSKDSQRIVYYGKRFDSLGNLLESGLYVGDLTYTGSTPTGVTNEHLVVPDIAPTTNAQGNVTTYTFNLGGAGWNSLDWMSGGNTRILFGVNALTRTASGAFVSRMYTAYIANVGAIGTAGPVSPVLVNIGAVSAAESMVNNGFYLSASPVDNRIAIGTCPTANGGRFDLFVATIPASYAGTPMTAAQITNSRNARNTESMRHVAWSLDSSYVYWDGTSPSTPIGIYRITSNGSSGQLTVLASKNQQNQLYYIRP